MINPKDLEVEKIILRRGTTFITNKLNSVIETEKVTLLQQIYRSYVLVCPDLTRFIKRLTRKLCILKKL